MAEAIFQKMVDDSGLSSQFNIDSAGTGLWHVGEQAHRGTRQILAQHNIPYEGRARQVHTQDMAEQNYIIAMDQSNLDDLQRRYGQHPRLYRLPDFASQTDKRNVPDPYYTGNFESVYQLVTDGCRGLLTYIQAQSASQR